jgi:hypothetical protein
MATYLSKEDLVLKLSPFGVKSLASIKILIKEQGLPAKYLTPRKVFFDEADVDIWIARRNESLAIVNNTHAKVIKAQREKRNKEKNKDKKGNSETAVVTEFKAEAKATKKAEA